MRFAPVVAISIPLKESPRLKSAWETAFGELKILC